MTTTYTITIPAHVNERGIQTRLRKEATHRINSHISAGCKLLRVETLKNKIRAYFKKQLVVEIKYTICNGNLSTSPDIAASSPSLQSNGG